MQVQVLFITIFLVGWTEMAMIGLIEHISMEFQSKVADIGEIIAAYSVSFAVGAPLVIYLTRNIPKRKVIISLSLIFLITNVISAVSPTTLVLGISRVIIASVSGALAGTILGSVINLVDKKEVGGVLSYILVGFGASLILGVPLSVAIADELGWRLTFIIICVLSILTLISQYKVLPVIYGNVKQDVESSEYMSRIKALPIESYCGLVFTFLWMMGYSILFTYYPAVLSDEYQLKSGEVSIILAVFGFSTLFGSKLGGKLSDRIGSKQTILVSFILHALILSIAGQFLISFYGAIVFSVLWGVVSWMSTPAIQALIALNSKGVEDIMLTLNNSFLHIGIAVGALIGGFYVSESIGRLYVSSALIVLLSAFLVSTLMFRQRKEAVCRT
ncbi:MFS transporter [Pseudoalteromonas sp. TAB23]|uniref:MFS transporter n=1 Tax=Pseudoalteromonas sp. TAB23 TaxID=1938595 RepID=UPI001300C09A|nr:MFS transporter [Pseudoalteromonas sp. TAB23]